MNHNLPRLIGALAAAAAILGVAGTAGAAPRAAAATSLKLCYANAATDFTPAMVAKNEGFFAKNGLDVDLVLASGGRGAQFLASGTCDMSLDSATPNITANEKGADFVLLGADANTFDFRLVTKNSITGVKGLVGKKLALSSPGAAVDIAGRAMLKGAGMNPSDVNIVYISSLAARLAALQSGSIDAMVISPPVQKVVGSGPFHIAFNLKGLHFILNGTWAKRSFAQQNADVVKRYFRADVEAIAFLKNPKNKAAVLRDVGAVTGFTDPNDTEEAYDDVLRYQQPEPVVDGRALTNSVEWVENQLNKQISVSSFLDLGPLQQVLTRRLSATLTPKQMVPKPKGAKGSATFKATLTPTGKLRWLLTTKKLSGKPVYAGLHIGKRGKAAPAVLKLCGPCKLTESGTVRAETPLATAIKAGNGFVTVATAKNPKGEIRGQIAAKLG